jgi:hypothetical protein
VTRARTLLSAVWHLWELKALRLEDILRCLRAVPTQPEQLMQESMQNSGRNTADSIHASRIASMTLPGEAAAHGPPMKTSSADLAALVAASGPSSSSVLTADTDPSVSASRPKHGRSRSVDFWNIHKRGSPTPGEAPSGSVSAGNAVAASKPSASAGQKRGDNSRLAQSSSNNDKDRERERSSAGMWRPRTKTTETEFSEASRSMNDVDPFTMDPLQVSTDGA